MRTYDLPEIKSDKARLIIRSKPSIIIRIGVIILIALLTLVFIIIALIKIDPQLNTKVVIVDSIQAYAMLPYKEIVTTAGELPVVVAIQGFTSSICTALLEKKEAYISNNSIYWKVPLVIDKSINDAIIVAYNTKTTASFPLVETSILRYVFGNLFDSNSIHISCKNTKLGLIVKK